MCLFIYTSDMNTNDYFLYHRSCMALPYTHTYTDTKPDAQVEVVYGSLRVLSRNIVNTAALIVHACSIDYAAHSSIEAVRNRKYGIGRWFCAHKPRIRWRKLQPLPKIIYDLIYSILHRKSNSTGSSVYGFFCFSVSDKGRRTRRTRNRNRPRRCTNRQLAAVAVAVSDSCTRHVRHGHHSRFHHRSVHSIRWVHYRWCAWTCAADLRRVIRTRAVFSPLWRPFLCAYDNAYDAWPVRECEFCGWIHMYYQRVNCIWQVKAHKLGFRFSRRCRTRRIDKNHGKHKRQHVKLWKKKQKHTSTLPLAYRRTYIVSVNQTGPSVTAAAAVYDWLRFGVITNYKITVCAVRTSHRVYVSANKTPANPTHSVDGFSCIIQKCNISLSNNCQTSNAHRQQTIQHEIYLEDSTNRPTMRATNNPNAGVNFLRTHQAYFTIGGILPDYQRPNSEQR